MKKGIKYAAIAAGIYLAYRLFYERQGTVTIGAIQQYPAAWDDYWDNTKTSIGQAQKDAIQREIIKGNFTYT